MNQSFKGAKCYLEKFANEGNYPSATDLGMLGGAGLTTYGAGQLRDHWKNPPAAGSKAAIANQNLAQKMPFLGKAMGQAAAPVENNPGILDKLRGWFGSKGPTTQVTQSVPAQSGNAFTRGMSRAWDATKAAPGAINSAWQSARSAAPTAFAGPSTAMSLAAKAHPELAVKPTGAWDATKKGIQSLWGGFVGGGGGRLGLGAPRATQMLAAGKAGLPYLIPGALGTAAGMYLGVPSMIAQTYLDRMYAGNDDVSMWNPFARGREISADMSTDYDEGYRKLMESGKLSGVHDVVDEGWLWDSVKQDDITDDVSRLMTNMQGETVKQMYGDDAMGAGISDEDVMKYIHGGG